MKTKILQTVNRDKADGRAVSDDSSKFQRGVILQQIAEDLASIPGHTHRVIRTKLIRTTLADSKMDVTPLHWEIIRLLEEEGTLHCAEIGRKLQIAKAQITKLIDRLVALRIVQRQIDTTDRRLINIHLTKQGKAFLIKHKNNMLSAIETSMSGLTDRELEDLSLSIREIHDLLSKLE